MKKISLSIIIAILSSLNIMGENISHDVGIVAGIGYRIGERYINYVPRLGYRFSNKFEMGFVIKYSPKEKEKRDLFNSYGAYAKHSVFRHNDFNLFIELNTVKYHKKYRYSSSSDRHLYEKCTFEEIGFTPGISYTIPNTHLDLNLRYLFIGYNNSDEYKRDYGVYKLFRKHSACLGGGSYILDAGLRRFEIGVSYKF